MAGLFEIGLADHDAVMGFAALEDVARLAGPAAPAGVHLFFADPFDAPRLAPGVASALGTGPARDWTVDHAAYFRAIRLEKTMMTVILLLIVSVAAFNIVASLVMVVAEKRSDIAILRTMGLSRAGVIGAFVVQGTVIGWIGTLAGVGLGILLAVYAGDITPVLEQAVRFPDLRCRRLLHHAHPLGTARRGCRAGRGRSARADTGVDDLPCASRGRDRASRGTAL